MALHSKNGKLKNKFEKLNTSEVKFNNHIIDCVADGLLTVGEDSRKSGVDISENQYDFISSHRGILYRTAVDVYTDGAGTMGRPLSYMTSGISHSPSKALKLASERNSESHTALRILKWLLNRRGVKDWHAYFVTLTVPNVDMGQLADGIKKVRSNTAKVVKALQDGTRNKNGLRLLSDIDDNGNAEYANLLGALMSLECTIKPEFLIREYPKGIFHPHTHLLIITDKSVDMKYLEDRLFKYWSSKFSGQWLSPDAFIVEKSWNTADSISEMSKYIVKPDFYPRLPVKPTAFTKKLFAELFKAIKGVQAKATYGLLGLSMGLVKTMNKSPQGKFVLSSVNAGALPTDNTGYAPDVVTKVTTVSKKSCKSKELDDDELLYANRGILQYSVWHKPQGIKYPDTKKGRLMKALVEDIDFAQSIYDVLDTWKVGRTDKVSQLETLLDFASDDQKKPLLRRRLAVAKAQLEDVNKLSHAVENNRGRGGYIRTHDYSTHYKRIALFRQLDFHSVRVTWKTVNFKSPWILAWEPDSHATVPVNMPYGLEFPPDADPDLEEKLAQMYLKVDPLDDIKFIDSTIVLDYFLWKHPDWTPKFNGVSVNMYQMMDTDLAYWKGFSPITLDLQTFNPMTDDDFQDWVDGWLK